MSQYADAILLLSGGIDSTTVLAQLVSDGRVPLCLIFDYGQILREEVAVAVANASRYKASSSVLSLDMAFAAKVCSLLGGPPIVQDQTIDQIDKGGLPTSYVPFRNGIFLAYAVAIGEVNQIGEIYAGANGLNSGDYPDDTAEFAEAFTQAARIGTGPKYKPSILFPLARCTKAQVVQRAIALGVDLMATLSCYQPQHGKHCGRCDSCIQRVHAMGVHGLNLDGSHCG
jgi:7-cyano-7-deazaguanine synthase